jgi:hypothetical protein
MMRGQPQASESKKPSKFGAKTNPKLTVNEGGESIKKEGAIGTFQQSGEDPGREEAKFEAGASRREEPMLANGVYLN